MPYYNAHSHIFTMTNAPENFLELYMPKPVANAIDNIANTKVGSWAIKRLLKTFGGSGGKRYASFLEIGKSKNQNEVLRRLLESYDDTSMKVIALTLNMEFTGVGRSTSGYEGQLEEIISLRKRYPDNLMIFLSLDPRWKASGQEIRDTVIAYFERQIEINATRKVYPFAGLKLYPSTGYYGFDEKLKPTMEWAAANGVPIMTHCAYLGGIYNNDADFLRANLNPHDPYANTAYHLPKYYSRSKKSRTNNQYSCSYFLEPFSYKTMIEYFAARGTPLKICFAHYGGNKHMLTKHAEEDKDNYIGIAPRKNWTMQIRELMKSYPGVYTDISYSLTDKKTYDFIFNELREPSYGERILFGTDYFMTEREEAERNTYTAFKSRALQEKAYDGSPAWDKMAKANVEAYLSNKYV